MKNYRIIIAGSRGFDDYEKLKIEMRYLVRLLQWDEIEIVSGGARGADKLGERYAEENGFPVKIFPADWETHGMKAGYLRNKQMAEYATHCVCFWDGKSKGTEMMIRLATEHKLIGHVVKY